MAWIRLSDDYNDHPKFDCLSDGAFRLWHQAIGFCRKYKTDGHIPIASVRKFKAYSHKRGKELLTPWQAGASPLWEPIAGFGIKVHDYLEWNASKDEETDRRTDSRLRMRDLRERRKTLDVTRGVSANREQTSCEVIGKGTDPDLQESTAIQKPFFRGERVLEPFPPDDVADRAAQLLEKYAELFQKYRRGALYHRRDAIDFPKACDVVRTWTDDVRLEKLVVMVLTTDDPWVSRTDRGFGIFVVKASWADDLLKQWELENGVAI
jgi:hypothetical protein